MLTPWEHTLDTCRDRLAPLGFDCLGPLNIPWMTPAERGPWMGPARDWDEGLAIVIANTRALWPPFLEALTQEPERLEGPDPLDRWVEDTLGAALGDLESLEHLAFSHTLGEGLVPIQGLGVLGGLGAISPGHLLVHPTYGPWISLRGVALFKGPGPEGPRPAPNLPCDACHRGCSPALAEALAHTQILNAEGAEAQWTRWLRLREACPVGREHRFPEYAIQYHYRKDRSILRRMLGI